MVFEGVGQPLVQRRLPLPRLGPGQALVKVRLCTLCGSDLHTYEGRRPTPLPTILGHEILGEVVGLSEQLPLKEASGQPLQLGQRVVWSVAVSCQHCFYCGHGLPQKCESLVKYGHTALAGEFALSGGLATHCHLLPGTAVFAVPEGVPDEVACPASCATATVAAALRYSGDLQGQSVLIQGAGMLGLTATAMAAAGGASPVIVCDPKSNRLEIARQFGADCTLLVHEPLDALQNKVREVTDGRGVDVGLELSGSLQAIEVGVELLRVGGRYLWVGSVFPTEGLGISPERFVRKMLSVQGIHNYKPEDLGKALQFLNLFQTKFPFAELVSQRFPLDQADQAFCYANRQKPLRVSVVPEESCHAAMGSSSAS